MKGTHAKDEYYVDLSVTLPQATPIGVWLTCTHVHVYHTVVHEVEEGIYVPYWLVHVCNVIPLWAICAYSCQVVHGIRATLLLVNHE